VIEYVGGFRRGDGRRTFEKLATASPTNQETHDTGARSGTVTDEAQEHQRLIVDQFTQQAVPFSQMPDQSPELILAATGVRTTDTVLDGACGPGILACAFAQVAHHVAGIDLTPAMIERAGGP
jgi:2-polyprenyl-3-methyl-5-hydroxy-6-metoxy-1,4-benzoquinol methylase